jgi:putative endonuclease
MHQFYVYILASKTAVLYIGMTNELERRVSEHKQKLVPGFTAKYNVSTLVWYDAFSNASDAIAAEKKIKGWTRAKKVALIESMNPKWRDLSLDAPESDPRHPERTREGSRGPGDTISNPRSFAAYRSG